jgi:hypothetical protein
MTENNASKELEVFQQIVSGLSNLEKDVQTRILQSVATFLQIGGISTLRSVKSFEPSGPVSADRADLGFTERQELSPKEFILEKEPQTAVARVACLAYYLTRYRGVPHFKAFDISKLNTEAAQQKFSNPTQALNDAVKCGLLVQASGGQKQLSAMGEQYVRALPNQDLAKEALHRMKRPRKSSKKATEKEKT